MYRLIFITLFFSTYIQAQTNKSVELKDSLAINSKASMVKEPKIRNEFTDETKKPKSNFIKQLQVNFQVAMYESFAGLFINTSNFGSNILFKDIMFERSVKLNKTGQH